MSLEQYTSSVLFRGMTPSEDGLPVVARSARALGVRADKDIRLNSEGRVLPGCGGMSVAPSSVWNLPNHRRPRGMGRGSTGPAADRMFSIAPESVSSAGLLVRPDPERPAKHAFIEPPEVIELFRYEAMLGSTRTQWKQVWP